MKKPNYLGHLSESVLLCLFNLRRRAGLESSQFSRKPSFLILMRAYKLKSLKHCRLIYDPRHTAAFATKGGSTEVKTKLRSKSDFYQTAKNSSRQIWHMKKTTQIKGGHADIRRSSNTTTTGIWDDVEIRSVKNPFFLGGNGSVKNSRG